MTMSIPSLYDSFALYGSGVTLVTVRDGDEDRFFIAASVLTASVSPFTLALSVGRERDAVTPITDGAPWAVSVLAEHHLPLVRQLTARTTRTQRLEALGAAGAETSEEGPLWLPDALVTFWCAAHSSTPVNDQILLVGNVVRGSSHEGGSPLLRWNRGFRTTGELRTAADGTRPISQEETPHHDCRLSADALERIGAAEELRISARRADGTLLREVPVWVVCVSGQAYVRTWYRRDNGWYGHAVHSRRARIRVPGLEAGIAVEDVGNDKGELRVDVDAAYRAKYGRYGEASVAQMVADDAAATTLRLIPERGARTGTNE